MATKQQFLDLLTEIEPSTSTTNACAAGHARVRDVLKSDDEFKNVHVNTFLSGSYKRDTAIRPRKKDGVLQRPDVDIIVITNHTTKDKPADVIDALYKALKRAGYQNLTVNRRSINISMVTVEMDVVPIIETGNGTFKIPDKDSGEWISTNPQGHTDWCSAVNMEAGGRFKPLVKLLKWWRRENLPQLRRPKGFILETLVAANMSYSETSYEELFLKLMVSIKDAYWWNAFLGTVPNVPDPSVPGNNVFSHVTPEEFKTFYETVEEHIDLIKKARAEQDETEALKKWRAVFGPCFPSSGTSRSNNNSLLRQAAPAMALTFPSAPIAVPNKPKGFA